MNTARLHTLLTVERLGARRAQIQVECTGLSSPHASGLQEETTNTKGKAAQAWFLHHGTSPTNPISFPLNMVLDE